MKKIRPHNPPAIIPIYRTVKVCKNPEQISYSCPRYRIALVKEAEIEWPKKTMHNAADAYRLAREIFEGHDRESVYIFMLDQKNVVVGINLVSMGTLTESLVHPREMFKALILANAAAFVMVHNHPSGDPTPSVSDRQLTDRIKGVSTLMGIRFLDSIVAGEETYYSFAESGALATYGGGVVKLGEAGEFLWGDNPPATDIVAAIRSPKSGKVFVGATHGDAFAASDIDSVDDLAQNEFLEAEGFAFPDGTGFMSRKEALERYGYSCVEDQNPPATDIVLARDYYHATPDGKAGESILKDGLIIPRPGKAGKAYQSPRKDFVYMSPQLYYAAIYALGGVYMGHDYPEQNWRNPSRYGYVFLVHKGDLIDVEPDEDDVGEMATADLYKRSPDWLRSMAEWDAKPTLAKREKLRRAKQGECAYQSLIGKQLLKQMSDDERQFLMNMAGVNIANRGPVGFDAAWKLDKSRAPEIAEDGSNVLEIAERIK